ncbi:hypothetical protein [Emcibacter sp. SYSU 3D8]|uniref:hypothetical protein n=1 Tax=Emcibacter sp. SYSU 3D8 TaxID=3133969 RepID=UPI0031FE4A5B
MASYDISVAVLSARETPEVLHGTVRAAIEASRGMATCCDVVVNGPSAVTAHLLRDRLEQDGALPPGMMVRIFHLPVADKAHAWNEYVHSLWPGSALAFFIDGYARVLPDALASIRRSLGDDPDILGGTGVPTHSRSALRLRDQMLRSGGIHGNLYALRGWVMAHFRDTGFRLPVGIYRTDSTVGSVVKFRLDPARHEWNERRMHVDPGATWTVAVAAGSPFGVARGQFGRMLRQAQGMLENRAVRQHLAVDRRKPEALPETARELVLNWVDRHGGEARTLFRHHPLAYLAYRRFPLWPVPRHGSDPVAIGQWPDNGGEAV